MTMNCVRHRESVLRLGKRRRKRQITWYVGHNKDETTGEVEGSRSLVFVLATPTSIMRLNSMDSRQVAAERCMTNIMH